MIFVIVKAFNRKILFAVIWQLFRVYFSFDFSTLQVEQEVIMCYLMCIKYLHVHNLIRDEAAACIRVIHAVDGHGVSV